MKPQYLIRFDDITPTMNWLVWSEVEKILIDLNVKPILAVIPDNQDKDLQIFQPAPQFWDKVRQWQRLGWTIGLHGYQHRCITREAGLVGLNLKSEFVGLPLQTQEDKLRKAIEVFQNEDVNPEVWIAPFHSFDSLTLIGLKKIGINCISDGLFLLPYKDSQDMIWIPQQLWKFRPLPFGIWTICFHCNHWTESDLKKFRTDVYSYQKFIASFHDVIPKRKCGYYNHILNQASGNIFNLILGKKKKLKIK
ncbi:DUF2334 domain-containing protein [Oscillatoria sp. HE19RPO]|uniref:DUF2334 domain-containing protein n=1 Tax=Oscillatoria sp. HE19RPO TaxID=2954806 RepID=UPI0020C4F2E3|nr:DUF2334 domain-containing protein [Oscillatoria sp. HE19RPO]